MSMRLVRVVFSGLCAFLGAALLFLTARSRRWAEPVKETPQSEVGGPYTAITLELPGAPAWVLISSAVVGAIAFGMAGCLLIGLLFRDRTRMRTGDRQPH